MAKVEIIHGESFVVNRGVGALRKSQQNGIHVTHVVPADYVGTVGKPEGMLFVG
jgi:hypothetical protein